MRTTSHTATLLVGRPRRGWRIGGNTTSHMVTHRKTGRQKYRKKDSYSKVIVKRQPTERQKARPKDGKMKVQKNRQNVRLTTKRQREG